MVVVVVIVNVGRVFDKNTNCAEKSSMPHDATLFLPTFYMCLICPIVLGVSLIKDVFLRYQHPVVI